MGTGGFRVEIDFSFVEVGTLVVTVVELEEPGVGKCDVCIHECEDDILTI